MITILILYKSVLAIPMLCIPPTDEGKRAQSRESEEEEQRFYSALVAEHAQLKKRQKKKEKRTDQIDQISFHKVYNLIITAEYAVCCQPVLKVSSST